MKTPGKKVISFGGRPQFLEAAFKSGRRVLMTSRLKREEGESNSVLARGGDVDGCLGEKHEKGRARDGRRRNDSWRALSLFQTQPFLFSFHFFVQK